MTSNRLRRGALGAALLVGAAVAGTGGLLRPTPPGPSASLPATTAPGAGGDPGPADPRSPPDGAERPPPSAGTAPVPVAAARLALIVERGLADARLAGTTVGLSVFVDGLGEVAVHQPDLALNPASNQKLYTAMAVLATLEPGFVFTTGVRATGALEDGVLHGDLVLVGGGDPTLTARGPHSLDALAGELKGAGVEQVPGALVGDDSRYDNQRQARGWFSWHVPRLVGPLSALTVDRNQHRADAAFVADPLPANLNLFRAALARQGISVAGANIAGPAPPGSRTLAQVRSVPLGQIVAGMLTSSDNTAAELLVKEIGYQLRGRGTTAEGVEAADAALAALRVPIRGQSGDGSGLSRADRRSAREWRRLLQAARAQPWGERLVASLPLAGRTGTLRSRFRGTAAEANLRAKTGWILEGRALSGYLTTAGGRRVVFSVVVNGTTPEAPVAGAIDDLVAALAAERS
ncbi:MAG: D-alanyl-D-alanine carboxypeptidase/D-alanyl-D-alanine endopeptidase [Acidimicrobiales bacterium]